MNPVIDDGKTFIDKIESWLDESCTFSIIDWDKNIEYRYPNDTDTEVIMTSPASETTDFFGDPEYKITVKDKELYYEILRQVIRTIKRRNNEVKDKD
jgi:hypothetical protein